uniref:Uncharacterized protein n=1 Tax=Trichogramma kaykai TaxID=54128 RepID=A0ABD2VSQ6_9HYME
MPTILSRYSGVRIRRSAALMLFHRAELNAFFTSRVTTAQYFLVPRFHLLPAMASRAVAMTFSMALIAPSGSRTGDLRGLQGSQ